VLDELSSARERDPSPQPGGRAAWVRRGLAALVVVALGALTVANLLGEGDESERPLPRPTASSQPTNEVTPTSQPLSALRWTVRGNLADDTDFTDAVLDVARQSDPGAEKVLYAATLPDRSRFALVATGYQDSGSVGFRSAGVQALHVSAGAAPSVRDLSFAGEVTNPDALVGWAGHGRDGEVYAVLLGRPAPLEAHVSSAIDYTKDGTAHRGWQPVRSRDGAAIVELGRETDPIVVARTTYGEDSYPLLMTVDGDPTDEIRNEMVAGVRIDGLDESYRGPKRAAVSGAVVDGSWVALDPRRADIRVLWSGRLKGKQRGALLLLRRPDGATFQLFVFQGDDGSVYPQGIHPVAWADAHLVPWILQSGQPEVPQLLVNRSGAGTATIARAGGEAPVRFRIGRTGVADLGDDPAAVARMLSSARVTVLAPSGRELVRVQLPGSGEDDPYALDSL
jgi:hypothetical protein